MARKNHCASCGKRASVGQLVCAWCHAWWHNRYLQLDAWDYWANEVQREFDDEERLAQSFGVEDIRIAEALVRGFWALQPRPPWLKAALPYLMVGGAFLLVYSGLFRRRFA